MLYEKVKSFLFSKAKKEELNPIPDDKVLNTFDDTEVYSTGAFFDDNEFNTIFSARNKSSILEGQKSKIMLYRNIAKTEEVFEAIDEITNEIIYSENDTIIKVQLNEENEKIQTAVESAFKKISNLMKLNKNMYNIVKQSYIDGQIIIYCQYEDNIKNGLKNIKMIDPIYFYYDKKKEVYKYHNGDKAFFQQSNIDKSVEYERENVIRNTFGLAEGQINLGYLEYGIKSANQLKTLEDLLIPMRFSRSISRRVFNVDTGELSPSKSEDAMREMNKKFKYRKFYNTESGEITNQQHITSMVEDYWFANRSGGKGTTVDVLDETGNLGEINDILYFQKKLYRSLRIPLGRIANNPEQTEMDYDATAVSHDEMKFFLFISRLRNIYSEVFKDLLKRELISTGVMTLENYNEYEEKITIVFNSENVFLEKMKLSNFNNKIEIYSTVAEYAGKLFPVETILKDIFKLTDEEIDENFAKIEKESKDSKYKNFYQEDE